MLMLKIIYYFIAFIKSLQKPTGMQDFKSENFPSTYLPQKMSFFLPCYDVLATHKFKICEMVGVVQTHCI